MLGEMLEVGVKPPHRRLTATIHIGADNLEVLYQALVEIEHAIFKESWPTASGGQDFGWSMRVEEDSEMTQTRYFEELERWSNKHLG